LHKNSYTYAITYVLKAQAFWGLGQNDSALYYARHVMQMPDASDVDKYNMLYITSNNDPSIDKQEVLKQTSERADINNYNIKPEKKQLAVAVMLLRQDMDRKPDYKWLYAAILTALLMTALIAGRHIVTRKKHAAEKRKRQEDTANYNRFLKQAETLLAETENTCTIMRQCQDIKTQLCWNDYGQMCRVINKQFSLLADRLGQIDGIHETDIRLCVLVLIGFSLETIADILPCSPNSVKTLKRRTALKLGTNSRDLRMFLLKMAANMPK
jgi:DNA-binding CsgD family transcriptional regulator